MRPYQPKTKFRLFLEFGSKCEFIFLLFCFFLLRFFNILPKHYRKLVSWKLAELQKNLTNKGDLEANYNIKLSMLENPKEEVSRPYQQKQNFIFFSNFGSDPCFFFLLKLSKILSNKWLYSIQNLSKIKHGRKCKFSPFYAKINKFGPNTAKMLVLITISS